MLKRSAFLFILLLIGFIPFSFSDTETYNPIAQEVADLKNDDVSIRNFYTLREPFIKTLYTQADNVKIAKEKKDILSYIFFTLYPMIPLLLGEDGALAHIPLNKAPHLDALLSGLCKKLEIPKPEVYLLDQQHRRNLYTTSITPNNSVLLLSENMLQLLSKEELETAIAHELTHIKKYDAAKQQLLSLFKYALLGGVGLWFLNKEGILSNPQFQKYSAVSIILYFALTTISLAYHQHCENRANLSAINLTRKNSFISMSSKIEEQEQLEHEHDYAILQEKLKKLTDENLLPGLLLRLVSWLYHQGAKLLSYSLIPENENLDTKLPTHHQTGQESLSVQG